MSDERLRVVAAAGLVIGAVLGVAGAFAPSAELRALAWGIDGTAIIVGCAIIAVHHLRRGDELRAAGLLVFMVGETLIVSASAVALTDASATLAAGAALWAAGLALVSASPAVPLLVRGTGGVAAALLAATSVRIFGGAALTPLSKPLPFVAYPFLAATLVGWAWTHVRPGRLAQSAGGA